MITYIEFDADNRLMLVDADVDELVEQAGGWITVETYPCHQVLRYHEPVESYPPDTTFFSLDFSGLQAILEEND